ncbi:sensor histidine kinase [Allosalinactinospora lopnorensis]|uniref:sensor histidine kinase n=1 Tax=Allosalinactinospora lopnorensis TaxID=1352348 RepID=UPI000623DC15|nr:ATP-binding protein [Allosalinactinospora lopnorensis]
MTPSRPSGKLRHSLLARMLASSVLVAVCSITATAWLAVQGTSESLSTQQGQTLTVDTQIHDTLVGYAAAHPDWSGVRQTVEELAAETGRRIVLTTENRRPLADSAAGDAPLPARTSSVVDPLAVDVTLASEGADRIDPRAVGPFALDGEDRSRLRKMAQANADCLDGVYGLPAKVKVRPTGRPAIELPEGEVEADAWAYCGLGALDRPTDSEQDALDDLNELIDACIEPHGIGDVDYRIDGTAGTGVTVARDTPRAQAEEPEPPVPEGPRGQPAPSYAGEPPTGRGSTASKVDPRAAACVDSSRREQLDPHVAPAALLFIDHPAEDEETGLALSREGALRVFGVVLLVLMLTVGVSVTVSTRLVRPVRALTDAVQRMRAGEGSTRVRVRDSGEIGRLASAFNEMSEHLEQLEEQRKAMVSDVSHELRTPLSNLRGWLEAAQDGVADLKPERMTMLVEEAQLLQRIIDDLQELALADAGKLRLSPESVDAGDLVEQAAASHRLRAESAGLELVTEVSGNIPLVADRSRLLQAIGNLLGNALRHTPAPGRVTVRAHRSDGDAVIEVADTGTGIAPEHLPHVFNRFWRAEKSRNRQTGGSGLGLAIVRNIAELHGGGAEAASTPGEGSTFTLRLPLEPAHDRNPPG